MTAYSRGFRGATFEEPFSSGHTRPTRAAPAFAIADVPSRLRVLTCLAESGSAVLTRRRHLLYRHLGSVAETAAFSGIQKLRLYF